MTLKRKKNMIKTVWQKLLCMSKPIHFEYQEVKGITVVALDAKLSDFGFQPVQEGEGEPMVRIPEKTIKDCRNIDGCVYLHLGRVSDAVMTDLIEKFQKLRKEGGWKQQESMIVPDPKFIL